ncbi:N-acetylglucosaminyldiphosphoundecaprenol N-acetyl-beta-D-mannosaminyltransferase [Cytobacillus oceanisediminis]|uniref:N-acetylglucosaminyldiphosphoundecaprenol N-acetyl-beta-D-mannosaminyltransferase n=1 Tax=Cytobacillus oceanisediminis TaxID=665099 RepID=A0A2V3A5V2_9BACI|nr:WecB/TagA/CpsF family glycosyltransferase [Cytobacillus oceanisediminis]PWW31250.1 N-acetylglucosaminyldiphosphoundecaprenol N-acetyl-beta-D-mannosaminyltransferase [Cytobacillus oceanisediminis]
MTLKFVDILGVPFINITRSEFVKLLDQHIEKEEKAFVVTANPEIVMKAIEEPEYKSLLDRATYITADGIGVVKGAGLLGKPLPERVTGYDTMIDLLALGNEKNFKIYLLGAQQETIEKAVANIGENYPNVEIVGSHNGFFDWDSQEIPNEIQEKKPDLVFVALGVPRQEKWIATNIGRFEKGVFIGVGGSFDVIAGTVERAPEAWQKANLEWLYRLIKQPSRFGRMMALPRFAVKILTQKVKNQK